MRGLQANERDFIYATLGDGECDPNGLNGGEDFSDEDNRIINVLIECKRMCLYACHCGIQHVKVTPAGMQALELDKIARQTVPV